MAERARIDGGPADGLATAPGDRFVWLEVVVLKRSERTDTGALYELVDGAYVFVGGRKAYCDCGAIVAKPDGSDERQPCGICGAGVDGSASLPSAREPGAGP